MIRLDVAVAAAAVCVSNREEIFFSPPLSISITLLCAQKRLLLLVVVVHTHTTKRRMEEAFLNAIEKETRERERNEARKKELCKGFGWFVHRHNAIDAIYPATHR